MSFDAPHKGKMFNQGYDPPLRLGASPAAPVVQRNEIKMKNACKVIICLLLTVSVCHGSGITRKINHTVEPRDDGGYTLTFSGIIQSLMPITPEAFFPE
jgi:hypothetical protein